MNESREQKAAAARARLHELAGRFLERTAGDITAMRESLAKWESGSTDALHDVRHLAHRMAGTGATLGFEPLADRAAHLEELLESCPADSPPAETLRLQISGALEALDAEYRRSR
jgi:HPt (histidine-containing phosphotransfer) domain-containing protein